MNVCMEYECMALNFWIIITILPLPPIIFNDRKTYNFTDLSDMDKFNNDISPLCWSWSTVNWKYNEMFYTTYIKRWNVIYNEQST